MTDSAKAGLKNIRDFIGQDSPEAVRRFVKDLVDKLFSIAALGIKGTPRDWVSRGLLALPYRERCFYFCVIDNKRYVVRVLHGKQDVAGQSFSSL